MAGFNPHCIGGLHGSLLRQVVELLGMVTTGAWTRVKRSVRMKPEPISDTLRNRSLWVNMPKYIYIYNITCLVRIEVLSHQRFTQKPHISFLSDQWKWRHVESVWDSLNFGDFPYRWIKQSTSLSSNQTWLAGKSLRWRFLARKFISPCDFLATFHYLQVPIS